MMEYSFLASIICSAAVLALNDMFRAMRKAIHFKDIFVMLSDVLFWLIASAGIICCFWSIFGGELRMFMLIGAILGVFIYYLLFRRVLSNAFLVIFKIFFKITGFILKILLTPIKFLYKILMVTKRKLKKETRGIDDGKIQEKS